MGEKEARNLLEKRLYLELQVFRYSILRKSKREIYDSAYKIELMETIYDILLEKIQSMKEDQICHLLWWHSGILEPIYHEWLKKDDSSYEEMLAHVKAELKLFSNEDLVVLTKEDGNGKKYDKVA